MFGNLGGGNTEPKWFWNSVIFLCVMVDSAFSLSVFRGKFTTTEVRKHPCGASSVKLRGPNPPSPLSCRAWTHRNCFQSGKCWLSNTCYLHIPRRVCRKSSSDSRILAWKTIRTEKQPKDKVFGQAIPGTSGAQMSGHRKLFVFITVVHKNMTCSPYGKSGYRLLIFQINIPQRYRY